MYDALFFEFVQDFIYTANKFRIPIHMRFIENARYPNVVISMPIMYYNTCEQVLDTIFEDLEDKGFAVIPLTEKMFAIFHETMAILLEIQIDGSISFFAEFVPYDFSDEGSAA